DGYPDALDSWVGLILPRWNYAALQANNSISGCTFSADTFLQFVARQTAAQALDVIETKLYGAPGIMPAAERSRLQTYLLPDPSTTTRRKDVVGLALSAPSFQWY